MTSCSAWGQCPPGHVGTNSWDVLKTYVEKHTITYAYFCIRTNQICIIVSIEVPAYTKTSNRTICVPIVCQVLSSVVPGNENSQDYPTGFLLGRRIFSNDNCLPGKFSWGGGFTPTPKLNHRDEIVSPSSLGLFNSGLWPKVPPKTTI